MGCGPVLPHVDLTGAVLCKHARGFSLIMGASGNFVTERYNEGQSVRPHDTRKFRAQVMRRPRGPRREKGSVAGAGDSDNDTQTEMAPGSSGYEYGTWLAWLLGWLGRPCVACLRGCCALELWKLLLMGAARITWKCVP